MHEFYVLCPDFLLLREQYKFRVSENKLPMRKFDPKKQEVGGK